MSIATTLATGTIKHLEAAIQNILQLPMPSNVMEEEIAYAAYQITDSINVLEEYIREQSRQESGTPVERIERGE